VPLPPVGSLRFGALVAEATSRVVRLGGGQPPRDLLAYEVLVRGVHGLPPSRCHRNAITSRRRSRRSESDMSVAPLLEGAERGGGRSRPGGSTGDEDGLRRLLVVGVAGDDARREPRALEQVQPRVLGEEAVHVAVVDDADLGTGLDEDDDMVDRERRLTRLRRVRPLA
jgi:hypothetical protein